MVTLSNWVGSIKQWSWNVTLQRIWTQHNIYLQTLDQKIEQSDMVLDKADEVFEDAAKVLDNYRLIPLDEFLGFEEGYISEKNTL